MILFLSAGLLAVLLAYFSQFKGQRGLLVLSLIIIVIIMGLQDAIGNDFSGYEDAFKEINTGRLTPGFFSSEKGDQYLTIEFGWFYLNRFCAFIINDFHLVSVLVALLLCIAIYKVLIYVPSNYHWLAILLFYFSISHMILMMSALRQAFAVACFAMIVVYSFKKKIVMALLFVILGSSFHNSFIVSILFMLILFIPYNWFQRYKKIICLVLLISFAFISMYQGKLQENLIEQALPAMSEDADRYSYYVENIAETSVSTLASIFTFFVFSLTLFGLYRSCNKSEMVILLYAVLSYVALAFVGNNSGSFPRMFYYMTFFNIFASCITANHLRNPIIKAGFIVALFLTTGYSFITALTNIQYIRYLDYHTIFF